MTLKRILPPCLTLLLMTSWICVTSGDIFTSIRKIQRMVTEEWRVLNELRRYIDSYYERLSQFSNFHADRLQNIQAAKIGQLTHPNAVYKVIKSFATDYANALGNSFEDFRQRLQNAHSLSLADNSDIMGAKLSLLRLQSVYKLRAYDMARGDYLGYQGPPLDATDLFEIGQAAFTDGKLNESLEWLNVSLAMHKVVEIDHLRPQPWAVPAEGAIKGLMGRVHMYTGDDQLAEALYREARRLDPSSGDVIELGKELHTRPRRVAPPIDENFHNFSRLCSLENGLHPANPNDPSLVCRYRVALLPYYRFKEEFVSISPFASVMYNVLSDEESEYLKQVTQAKLTRGTVGDTVTLVSQIRTSDLAWVHDFESPKARGLSTRVQLITGLNTDERHPEGPLSGEPFQVVNYGLGGHYEVHMDPHDKPPPYLKASGERIATFLIYLTDVERGGATVFTRAGIAVAPVKNMALLWYSFSPAHQIENSTLHAGCPVLIGEKWVANKWIWTHGNIFLRRCGLTSDATQLDIEPDMRRVYK